MRMELLVPALGPLEAEGVSARGSPLRPPIQYAVACPGSGLMADPQQEQPLGASSQLS